MDIHIIIPIHNHTIHNHNYIIHKDITITSHSKTMI